MDTRAFVTWLTAFGGAWERRDADALAALFASGATVQPSPFEAVVRGRRRIAAYWSDRMASQEAIQFQAEILGVGVTYGIAHWRVTSRRLEDRAIARGDGIILIAFDRHERAASMRIWSQEVVGPSDISG
jgi:ketosteroid isomerase-like protein